MKGPEDVPDRERRRKFLEDAMVPTTPLEKVLEQHRVTEIDLARWLRGKAFRRRLARVMKGMTCRSELEVARGAITAAKRMAERAIGPAPDFEEICRRVCVDLIKLNRARSPRPARRADAPREPAISGDIPAEEAADLVRRLQDDDAA